MAVFEHEIAKEIKCNELFRKLAPAVIARLSTSATILNLRSGTRVCHRGKPCPGLYIVVNGRIMVSVGASGKAGKVLELIGPGGYVGLAATVSRLPLIVTGETLVDSTLLLISRQVLLDTAADNAELGLRLVAALSREVYALNADVEAFALHSGHKRIAIYLLQLAATDSTRSGSVMLPAHKGIIASRLNLTPEYFSRILHDLIKAGAIAVYKRKITILNSGRLRDASR
jgi:CRP/FNR family transcriptional regulator, dissimilatory nitrate respiration regulator